ncbi:MAG TPA: hypothetical protein VMT22_03850 [Terriglobales bacterium]|jgi:hypothetical protein|nr:hypothetical protein [Terriglobales bacterium]
MKTLSILIAVILAGWLDADPAMNEQFKVIEDLGHRAIELPLSAPERSRLRVVDSVLVVEQDGAAGVLIYYDDLTTKRDIDYIEAYDIEGELLLATWIDRFGICQVAMDRGLLDAEEPKIEGVLVMVTLGAAI